MKLNLVFAHLLRCKHTIAAHDKDTFIETRSCFVVEFLLAEIRIFRLNSVKFR